jgi:hypothetical protein
MKQPDRPFALAIWHDAKVINDEVKIEDISNVPWTRFHTAGWLIKENAEGYWIAAEWAPEDHTWRTVTSVPKGMLVELTVMNLSKRRTKKAPVEA